MRIGFVWNTISDEEYQLAKDVHRWAAATLQLSSLSITETFTSVFQFAQAQSIDFCVLSHRSAWAINPQKVNALLQSEGVQKAAVAVRVGKIYVKAGVFSPKAPFVDPDFILINVRKCQELGIPQRLSTVPFTSHFTKDGGVSADLLALLETIVPYGALLQYDDGSELRDLYGRKNGFKPSPGLVDLQREFISADVAADSRVVQLRSATGFKFLKEQRTARMLRWAGEALKRLMCQVNFEIHKKYAP